MLQGVSSAPVWDETVSCVAPSPAGHSCWWDVKHSLTHPLTLMQGISPVVFSGETSTPVWPSLNMTSAIGRTLNTNSFTLIQGVCRIGWALKGSHDSCHFSGVSASNPMQIWPVLTDSVKESLTWIEWFWQVSAIVVLLKSRDSQPWSLETLSINTVTHMFCDKSEKTFVLCYFHKIITVLIQKISPSGKGLTSWLSFVLYFSCVCVFFTFPSGTSGQVWYSRSWPSSLRLWLFYKFYNSI